ncbi:MAG: hypothetical protein LAQ30_08670 [Acidobacteriia bacterium]|nr:hypothetical protein [Terriglobia bacterium]
MRIADAVVDWLLGGDPSIRWQVLRDLRDAAERTVERERKRVAETGWGARLLGMQRPDGRWTRGIYTPKWTSTTYTMVLLRSLGLPPRHPRAMRACRLLLDEGCWTDGGINYWRRSHQRSETCVSGMILAVACWFGLDDPRVDRLAGHVMEQQMPDGGWNCRAMPGYGHATHGSFHTTISCLEGLMEYERFRGASGTCAARGREFLLVHRLFRSHRTGKVAKPEFTRFSFPPRWHYDVLRGLDYFRECGAGRDPRLEDAIALVRRRQTPDGRWLLQNRYPGETFFEMEEPGEPSRWNTLRALRVLRWWASDMR